jgi:carbon starvation protein
MHAMPLILGVLAILAIAFRFYSHFLAAKVACLDDSRETPAHARNDGQNFHPTNKWVLFGHHFAAISGAGPLIGPVLAIQFGYLPGLVWIVIGVCLAGAVQDMLVLACSVRRGGRSLAEIARSDIGPAAGVVASIAILFVVIIALAGLGMVVVKALGGEEISLAAGAKITPPPGAAITVVSDPTHDVAVIPAGSSLDYGRQIAQTRSESFTLRAPRKDDAPALVVTSGALTLPPGTKQFVAGSSWGAFTIFCTIPIALFVGLYMYKIRKGAVVEASLLGAVATLAATVAGAWIPGSPLEPWFSLTREQTILALCLYGFIASVLPVWLLLCPRDYLSSFLKIGTVGLLVLGVIIANPKFEAPPINPVFASGGGPYFNGAIFPFCFICIMCGAVSGFHALVSSGTTPKMVSRESDIRLIGYGSMLIEGLVAVVALIAAATLPQGDYWAINIDLAKVQQYTEALERLDALTDDLDRLEQQVGGESLRGRTGGAVTLAVGMAQIFTEATRRVAGGAVSIEGLLKYWYHFAIMFEALFILTTIDTGTRIARFLLQEVLGKVYAPFERPDWLPGAILSTALVTAGWGLLILSGSIDTIWPMFGIANQLLAVIALTTVTTVLYRSGRGRYAPVTLIPMLFVISTTFTAAFYMVKDRFGPDLVEGFRVGNTTMALRGGLCLAATLFMVGSVLFILLEAVRRWPLRLGGPDASSAPAS